jgi:hypothetical protein
MCKPTAACKMSEGMVRLTSTWLAQEVTRMVSSPVRVLVVRGCGRGKAQTSYLCDEVG